MPSIVHDIFGLLGLLLRMIGLLVAGIAIGRLVFDHFASGNWQLQAIYVLGLFGVLIGVLAFSSASGSGAFALGIGVAYFMNMMPRKSDAPVEAPKEVA